MHPTDFPAAYTRFWGPIRAKCRRLLGATAAADDVAQEAFLRLWQSGPPLDGSTEARQVLAWLYLTSTRLSLDVLRRTRALIPLATTPPLTCAVSPHEVVAARSAIAALCDSASPEQLEAALLARVDGLSQPEVALVLGVSERTVRRLLDAFDQQGASLRQELS
ncbi:MAG TPA: sigma-70 family RNA polymerase sigma factor [Polyangiaceae bacterium]|jgi:RNA polymerase sigma-70 factor (ECF subfamily)|nr:sigma-70 family RNA polymerase sigma factor [Polyangiaceae bacterium]